MFRTVSATAITTRPKTLLDRKHDTPRSTDAADAVAHGWRELKLFGVANANSLNILTRRADRKAGLLQRPARAHPTRFFRFSTLRDLIGIDHVRDRDRARDAKQVSSMAKFHTHSSPAIQDLLVAFVDHRQTRKGSEWDISEITMEDAMKPTRTWIVIADGSRAHILLTEGPNKAVSFVPGTDFRHGTPPNRDIYADRPGRTHESTGVSRSAVERNDAHAQQKQEFVQTLIALLKEKLSKKEFDRWILVAPPEILSDFRQNLDHTLIDALAGEVAKDLTKIPIDKIPDHLHGVLPI
jgi:protein required for attachment to host cells